MSLASSSKTAAAYSKKDKKSKKALKKSSRSKEGDAVDGKKRGRGNGDCVIF